MSIRINSNIASLQAQRQLANATSSVSAVSSRLSSGLRIDRASDDAAGLSIASDLNATSRVYSQAVRNGNDGQSILAIADSALGELSNIVTRIRELAEQSANGSYSNKQREAIDKEAQALKKEYFRIAQSTKFNGVNLFDGTLGNGMRLQLGYGTNGGINASVGGAIGTGGFQSANSIGNAYYYSAALGDLNGDGVLDIVTSDTYNSAAHVFLGNGNGTFVAPTSVQTASNPYSVTLGELNGDGILDIVSTDTSGVASILFGNGDGTFRARTTVQVGINPNSLILEDLNGDSVLDIICNAIGNATATILLGNGNGTFRTVATLYTGSNPNSLTAGDLNGDGLLDVVTSNYDENTVSIFFGNGNGTFMAATSAPTADGPNSVTLGDLNGDGVLDIVTSDVDDDTVSILLGNGNGTSRAKTTMQTGAGPYSVTLGDLNGDGALDIVTGDGNTNSASILLGNGNGTFRLKTTVQTDLGPQAVTLGDLNGDGVLDIVTANSSDTTANILLGRSQSGVAPMLGFSLRSKSDALQSMGMLDRNLKNLAAQRGVIGVYQSRVGVALNNLAGSIENFRTSESLIRDADVAKESAELTRSTILQQAATSVLAQANQQPQLALRLIGNI